MRIEKYTGEIWRKRQSRYVILIIVISLFYTHVFSYVNWNSTYGGWLSQLVSIVFAVFLIMHWPQSKRLNFRYEILLLITLPFVASINTKTLYGQSFFDSIRALTGNFVWVFYLVLHRYKVQESAILKAFLVLALCVLGIQVFQQYTYPNVYFGVANEDTVIEEGLQEVAEQRNGLWRFRIGENAYFTTPILFAALVWARKRINSQLMFIIMGMLVSVYLTLTRQVIAACLLAIFLSFFLGKKNSGGIRALAIGVVLLSLLYAYSDVLFGSLAEQTSEDLTDSNIRVLAATYFINESITDPLVFLFGHGLPGQTGAFADLTYRLQHYFKFFTVDVGFIGMTYQFGIIYVIVCFRILWKLFFTYKRTVPLYIRMFVIFTGVMSIMIFPMTSNVYYLVWTMIMYIADLYINKSKAQPLSTK